MGGSAYVNVRVREGVQNRSHVEVRGDRGMKLTLSRQAHTSPYYYAGKFLGTIICIMYIMPTHGV